MSKTARKKAFLRYLRDTKVKYKYDKITGVVSVGCFVLDFMQADYLRCYTPSQFKNVVSVEFPADYGQPGLILAKLVRYHVAIFGRGIYICDRFRKVVHVKGAKPLKNVA